MLKRNHDNLALYFNEKVLSIIKSPEALWIFYEKDDGSTGCVEIPLNILRNYEIDFEE